MINEKRIKFILLRLQKLIKKLRYCWLHFLKIVILITTIFHFFFLSLSNSTFPLLKYYIMIIIIIIIDKFFRFVLLF